MAASSNMTRNRKGGGTRKGRLVPVQRAETPPAEAFEEASFLTIDLDVRSRRSLSPLMVAWPWAQRVDTGRSTSHMLILRPRDDSKTAEAAARVLLGHVETLSPLARRCWDNASKRTFDIGVQAGMARRSFEEVRFTPETLSRIAAIGARLQVTVYPPEATTPPSR
jgi:hypothetical protein